ncbi:MAG: hypothetical protein IKE29_05385 [Paenibacillus sp.]|uniref:hypothetical protein n=1 Tax=Paenibacillus sp. TaxID=58172 RepID=UPI0025D7E211|nr:hypothetical protein [Paenibacillus sp.]MBR2564039.1 hypothetical protein [Paenibacillus sp.]
MFCSIPVGQYKISRSIFGFAPKLPWLAKPMLRGNDTLYVQLVYSPAALIWIS